MKKLSRSAFTKVCAALLCFVLLVGLIAEAACIAFLCECDAYTLTEEDFLSTFYQPIAYSYGLIYYRNQLLLADSPLDPVRDSVIDLTDKIGRFSSFYDLSSVECVLSVTTAGKKVTPPETDAENGIYTLTIDIDSNGTYRVGDTENPIKSYDHSVAHAVLSVTLIDNDTPTDLAGLGIIAVRAAWTLRYAVYAVAFVNFVLVMLLMVYLCSVAGRRPGNEEIHLHFVERIPLDVGLAVLVVVPCLFILLCDAILYDPNYAWPLGIVLCGMFGLFCVITAEWLPISLAARLKVRGWWKNTVIFRVVCIAWRALRAMWRWLTHAWHYLPFVWRTLIFVAAAFIMEIFLALTELFLPLWCFNVLLACAAIWYAVSVVKLKNKASRLAAGDIRENADANAKYMPHELRLLSEKIDNIGSGLSRAVEEKMKSERMKTELITNVSHDIKTPLTSIVNYVELLSAEPLEGKAAEYVEVLGRQSGRMKKLIDDLVEASKATSGSVESHPAPLDLSVMAGQTGGEYAERLAARGLSLVMNGTDTPATVNADGRLVWRIWDNLLGNICKYAMPGTRVYIDIERRGRMIATVFRNISEQPLTKSGGELTERFVRGDDSRSGNGSGLGLSIAAGLASVQGGTLTVTADGDLFKAEVLLPAIGDEVLKSTRRTNTYTAPIYTATAAAVTSEEEMPKGSDEPNETATPTETPQDTDKEDITE